MAQQPIKYARPYPLPVVSIDTGRSGKWKYSPNFINLTPPAASVILTGKRREDYVIAEKQTRVVHKPGATVWHHVYDYSLGTGACTMQLVRTNVHQETIPHAGGCVMYAEHHGTPYRISHNSSISEAQEYNTNPLSFSYDKGEIQEFSGNTGIRIAEAVQMLYSKDYEFSRHGLEKLAERDMCIDAVLPLTAEESETSVESIYSLMGKLRTPHEELTPIALDAYGNIFLSDGFGNLFFYDHETDDCFPTDINLKDIIE